MDLKAFLEKLFGCRIGLVLGDAIEHGLRPVILETAVDAPAPGRKT
jgi:predicted nucleotidyltransferase